MTDTIWLWVTDARDIRQGGHTYELGSRWDEMSASIVRYSEQFSAPLLGRSNDVDTEHDETRAPIWGMIRRLHVLTPADAALLGAEIPRGLDAARPSLWAEVELSPLGAAAHANKQILYTSPRIEFGYEDEEGGTYPAVITELSCVGIPLQQKGQPSAWDTVSLRLSRRANMREADMPQSDMFDEVVDEVTSEEAAEVTLEAIVDLLEGLESRLRRLEEHTPAEEVVVEASADEDEEDRVKALEAMVRELQASLADKEADEAVAALRASHATAVPAAELKALYRRDRKAFQLLASALPKRAKGGETQARMSRSGGALDLSDPNAIHVKAKALQAAEGITYHAAISRVTKGA